MVGSLHLMDDLRFSHLVWSVVGSHRLMDLRLSLVELVQSMVGTLSLSGGEIN